MSIYAIGDLHLSHGGSKPMDVFGAEWENHVQKIKNNWDLVVSDHDLVIIPGDISWAMHLHEASADLQWLAELKGSKLLIKGNHDYWWNSVTKVRAELPPSIFALQNDHFNWEEQAICGTRGWICPGDEGFDNEQDQKLYLREIQRLQLSLGSATRAGYQDIIVALHFPPFNRRGQSSAFTEILEQYAVKLCIYGHIHDSGRDYTFQGEKNGVDYRFVAADGINFTPLKLC